jgi:hypothetical protein
MDWLCYDDEMARTKINCPICKKNIDWMNEKTFIMEYRNPHMVVADSTLFFHPGCFISTAGKKWAEKLGYTNEVSKQTPKP